MSTDVMALVDNVMGSLEELRDTLAAIEVNGQQLGPAVRIDAAGADYPLQVVITPPTYDYSAYGTKPVQMTVQIYCIVPAGAGSTRNLVALSLAVAAAVDENSDAAVVGSESGSWRTGGQVELPAQVLTVEVPL